MSWETRLGVDTPHARQVTEVLEAGRVDRDSGPSGVEAARRFAAEGPNEPAALRGETFWRRLVRQISQAPAVLLVGAGELSFLFGEVLDAAVIGVILMVNTTAGCRREPTYRKSLRSLT